MKEDYEEMKKSAQFEEYKFMERVLNDFEYQKIESDVKNMIYEIQKNKVTFLTKDGRSLEQVREYIQIKKA